MKGIIIYMKSDTIAAIATAMSPSGIGIIRLSGTEAFSIIDKIYPQTDHHPFKTWEHPTSDSLSFSLCSHQMGWV